MKFTLFYEKNALLYIIFFILINEIIKFERCLNNIEYKMVIVKKE